MAMCLSWFLVQMVFGLIASIREKVKGQRTEDLQMGLLDSLPDNIPLPCHLARSVVQRK